MEFHNRKKSVKTAIIKEEIFVDLNFNIQEFCTYSGNRLEDVSEIIHQVFFDVFSSEDLLIVASKLKNYGNNLYEHAIRTSIIAMFIGLALGFNKDELIIITKGSFFSDIGKLQLDPSILFKVRELEEGEYEYIKSYPKYGAEYMEFYRDMDLESLKCILQAREKWDGTGYPMGLVANEISKYAQVVGLASYIDAMCQNRVYRKSVTIYQAMSEVIKEENKHFNRNLIKKAIKILGFYNLDMFVELSTGQIARVSSAARYKPSITITQYMNMANLPIAYVIDMQDNFSVKIKDVLLKSDYDKVF